MLISAGLPLPKSIYIHGFVNIEGEKMSKTIGNVIDPFMLLEKYGAATWGYTKEEALKNIREVLEMTLEELLEDGEPITQESEEVEVFNEPRIAVTI